MALSFDLLCLGDSNTDLFLELKEASVACDLDKDNCKLLLNYAEKIPLESVHLVEAAGNAVNTSIGCRRLGLTTAIYTIVGDDPEGEAIRNTLRAEGVNCEYLHRDNRQKTNLSVILNYQSERTILVYHAKREYQLDHLPKARWLYYTSMARGHEHLHKNLPKLISEKGGNLVFNPGTYQLREGLQALKETLAKTTLLILNRSEASRLVGEEKDIRDLLKKLKLCGPKIIIITNGEEGAFAFDGKVYLHQGIFPGPVVERTGAGDAFASGLVSAFAKGKGLKEALRWGAANAHSVLQFIGATKGLLKEEALIRILTQNPHPQPKAF